MTTPDAALLVEAEGPPLKILLVEDDEFDVAVFRQAFSRARVPCEVVRCRDGEEVLAGLRDAALSIDLLVADHQLPGMSGFELCVELLESPPTFALVLLTGAGSEQMAIRALRAGIQDYIVKDASQEYLDLLPLVLPRVARRHRDRRAGVARSAESVPTPTLGDCAEAVRQRGGKVWVEDEEGSTSTLCFSVPLTLQEAAAWASTALQIDRPATDDAPAAPSTADREKRLRVLVVHANPIVTHVTRRFVEHSGCRFLTVPDGHKALEALEREAFDLVLMAAELPELDGLEATRRIRRHESSSGGHVPIVALGADPETGEDEACLEAGMDDVIVRPVDERNLGAALGKARAALDRRAAR